MSQTDAQAATHASAGVRPPLQTLREAVQWFWTVADDCARRRLLVALALVASCALLAAATPIALKLLVNSFARAQSSVQGVGAGDAALATSLVFLDLYARRPRECRFVPHGRSELALAIVVLERGTHDEPRTRNGAHAAPWRAQQSGMSEREELPRSTAQG